MLNKSGTLSIFDRLSKGELECSSFSFFLRQLELALVSNVQITASIYHGNKAVPHHWSVQGLTTLAKWIDLRDFHGSLFKLVRYPVMDWHSTFGNDLELVQQAEEGHQRW